MHQLRLHCSLFYVDSPAARVPRPLAGLGGHAGRSDPRLRHEPGCARQPATAGLQTATLRHTGSSNFAVFACTAPGAKLLVIEIGNYLGEVLLPSGTLLLEVTADGAWTVAP